MYTFNYNANIGSIIGYRLLLVASISDIGTCQKPTSVHLYNRNKRGPNTVPWVTPEVTLAQSEYAPLITTLCFLYVRKDLSHDSTFPFIPKELGGDYSTERNGTERNGTE